MNTPNKKKRVYRRVTPATVARFNAAVIAHGNGTAAVRETEPDEIDSSRRAWLIANKSKELDAGEYIDHQLQRIGVESVERVKELVQSSDERIATKNAHFVIDHVRGKALQRSESKHLNLNIEAVLS
jgi:hypothetical protein